MFVPHAKVRIVGLGPRTKKKRFHRRRLALRELLKMPCLLPTIITVFLGLLAVVAGTGMAVAGYIPRHPANNTDSVSSGGGGGGSGSQGGPAVTNYPKDLSFYVLKACSYLGPLIMAFGMFAIIVACVLYCEIIDKYSMLVPDKKASRYGKEELYEVIVDEMKKSYAQCLITAYTKAAERTMALMDNQSSSGDYNLSDPTLLCKPPTEPLTLDQQIDIECEGYTPSPPIPNKKYSVIQARIQRLRSEDNWLKTSSLPNIRRSENASIRRASRVARLKNSKNNSLSCDYTMDEARLRRKSMMLRSFLLGNSSSSGELRQKRASRRFSSVKVLPTENALSWDEISQLVNSTGSFPMTRLVQRRGTFACGDMRMRRMKFLLLLQASESKEKIPDNVAMNRRATVAGIRRNSFIPYTDCDRFIATEEKKHNRDRRQSFNPLGHTTPMPSANSIRRHSFYPIRQDDQIYVSDPYEQRRHSFNPIGISNMLKPEYQGGGQPESRRGSFNPDALHDTGRRGSYIPPQKSNFLMVPGVDMDHLVADRHPAAADSSPSSAKQSLLCPDPFKSDSKSVPGLLLQVPQETQEKRHIVERRHSYNPSLPPPPPPPPQTIVSSSGEDPPFKVPMIVINAETSGGFLGVPSTEYNQEERRNSFNCAETTKPGAHSPTAVSFKNIDRAVPQRLSFRLAASDTRLPSPTSHHLSPTLVAPHDSLLVHKAYNNRPSHDSIDIPTTYLDARMTPPPVTYQEDSAACMPLSVADSSRSISPISNVSCCGSEWVGTTRTASISSERTNRTVSPLSMAHTEYGGSLRDESLERPPTPPVIASGFTSSSSSRYHAMSPEYRVDPLAPPPSPPPPPPQAVVNERLHSPLSRRPSSFRSNTHRHKSRHRPEGKFTDSPCSVGSGPATILPSTSTSLYATSTALQRSKSASAIPSSETAASPPPFVVSYATLSPSASTARPTIKDKTTTRGRQRPDTDDKMS